MSAHLQHLLTALGSAVASLDLAWGLVVPLDDGDPDEWAVRVGPIRGPQVHYVAESLETALSLALESLRPTTPACEYECCCSDHTFGSGCPAWSRGTCRGLAREAEPVADGDATR